MNKAACIAYAARCREAAAKSTERAAQFAATFGGEDELTKRAMSRVERDNDAAREWDKLAAMHPQTRAKLLRDGSLPSEIFGYGEESTPAAESTPAPAPAATKTIKVVHTLYGYKGYVGAERTKEFGGDDGAARFDALCWLDEMLATGEYKLSEKSTLTMRDVEAHREPRPVRRIAAAPTMTPDGEAVRLVPFLRECLMGEDAPAEGTDIYADDFPLDTSDPFLLRAIALLSGELPREADEVPKLRTILIDLCNGAHPRPRDEDIYASTTLDGDAYVLRAAQVLAELHPAK